MGRREISYVETSDHSEELGYNSDTERKLLEGVEQRMTGT